MDRSIEATIEVAAPGSEDELAELAAETFPLACPPTLSEADMAAHIREHLSAPRFVDYLADPDRTILVQREGTRATGYVMLVFTDPTDPEVRAVLPGPDLCELSKCYLRADQHGQGLGHDLLTAAVDAARRHGSRGIWLGVNQENERAQRAYGRAGFRQVGTKHFRVGDQICADFVMYQEL